MAASSPLPLFGDITHRTGVSPCVVMLQIEDLRLSMGRLEREAARREDALKQEISDVQQVSAAHVTRTSSRTRVSNV